MRQTQLFCFIDDDLVQEFPSICDEFADFDKGESSRNQCDSDENAPQYSGLHLKLLYLYLLFRMSDRLMLMILTVLKEEGCDVPSSMYFFKKPNLKPKLDIMKSNLRTEGSFTYLSIVENLRYCVSHQLFNLSSKFVDLKVKIGIDGLPIFRSSPITLWPILFSIDNVGFSKPLPVAVFVGVGKPKLTNFLSTLSQELISLKGFIEVKKYFMKISKVTFICDAPARAFCQGTKGHSGYFSCSVCRIPGTYCHDSKKVIFPFDGTMFESRCDDMYETGSENNQHSISPLAKIVSFQKSFPPEYQHSVCQGVMRRLLASYLSNTHGLLNCRLSVSMKLKLDERVKSFSNALPREFQRKIRPFNEFSYFKATEFRTTLLYTGPLFFKNILGDCYYKHFCLLHFAIYVFISPSYEHVYENAQFCIQQFVLQLKGLFGSSSCTFNSHSILHLYDFVKELGPLDNFSAFKFENYLQLLKRRIKSGSFVVQQTINSMVDIRAMYRDCTVNPLYVSSMYPNNCAIVNNNSRLVPILVSSVNESNNLLLSGIELNFVDDIYDYPYPSRNLGIGKYVKSDTFLFDVHFVNKCVLFIDSDNHYVFPYANSSATF